MIVLFKVNLFFPAIFTNKLQDHRMKELIDRLQAEAGLTEEQAVKAITMMKDFAKEKFPLLSGAIEKVFTKYAPKEDEDFLH